MKTLSRQNIFGAVAGLGAALAVTTASASVDPQDAISVDRPSVGEITSGYLSDFSVMSSIAEPGAVAPIIMAGGNGIDFGKIVDRAIRDGVRQVERGIQREIRRNTRDGINGGFDAATGRTVRGQDGLSYKVRERNIPGGAEKYHSVATERGYTSYPDNKGTRRVTDDVRILQNSYGEWGATCQRINERREKCIGPVVGAPQ